MRLVSLFVPLLLWAATGSAQERHLVLSSPLETYIAESSFQAVVNDQLALNCRRGADLPPVLCAVAMDDMSLVTYDAAVTARFAAIELLKSPASSDDLHNAVTLLFAAQMVAYRYELERAQTDDDREIALSGLSLLYDELVPILKQVPDVRHALLSVWMAAQLRVEALGHTLGRDNPTKRLTNLANALNRYYDRSRDIHALQAAREIQEALLAVLESSVDAVSEARARLNLGNTYTRIGSDEGIEPGRHWNGLAVEIYAPGIERLRLETSPDNAEANRLMTGLIAQMAQSLLASPGDEYLNHRKAVANLEYAEENFQDRLSDERRVEFFLANVGARIQIIDRLALPDQQTPNVDLAIETFEREAPGSVERRPVPDTALGVHMAGASLYAFKGSLTGEAEHCDRALEHLREADKHVGPNLAINQDRLVYGIGALLECIVDTDPVTRGLDRLDPERLQAKIQVSRNLLGDDGIASFTADERAAIWWLQADGDGCKAAEAMFQATDDQSRLRFPEFWELTVVGLECLGQRPTDFVAEVRDWLTEREQTRAQSRSGYALIARADIDDLTDLALALASQGHFEDVLWLLDYANRSRMSPGLEAARGRMASAGVSTQGDISDDIVTWLEYDNPGDPARSFQVAGFAKGQIQLLSEAAAARQSLARPPPTPTVQDVTERLEAITQNRTITWFLLGGTRSGWLIARQSDGGLDMSFVAVDLTRAKAQNIIGQTHVAPNTGASGTFFDARRGAGVAEERNLASTVELWQVALADTSNAITETVVLPLYDALTKTRTDAGPTELPLVTLVVRNAIADLPLHAIPVGQAAKDCGDTLIDCFQVTWSGHAGSVNASVAEPLVIDTVPTYWGFEDPGLGGKSLASYGNVLEGQNFQVTSDPDKVLDTLASGPVGLWVLHGEYTSENPGASAFGLQPERFLTGASILGAPPTGSERRLQVLIGCQSALFDFKVQPTEQTGLAEPFHQVGIEAVVVASWNAETLMSRVFTHVLFENLNTQASPAAAYRQTILFLRRATVKDIIRLLDPEGFGRNLDGQTLDVLSKMLARFGEAPPMSDLTRFGAFRLVEG